MTSRRPRPSTWITGLLLTGYAALDLLAQPLLPDAQVLAPLTRLVDQGGMAGLSALAVLCILWQSRERAADLKASLEQSQQREDRQAAYTTALLEHIQRNTEVLSRLSEQLQRGR